MSLHSDILFWFRAKQFLNAAYLAKTNVMVFSLTLLGLESTICSSRVSEWLLFNANSAIFQLYHDENKLIFNEMMRSALY